MQRFKSKNRPRKFLRILNFTYVRRLVVIVISSWATLITQLGIGDTDPQLEVPRIEISEQNTAPVDVLNQQTQVRKGPRSLAELVDATNFDSRIARTIELRNLLAVAHVEELRQYSGEVQHLQASGFKQEVEEGIVQRWALLDPKSALSFVDQRFTEPRRSALFDVVFREWSVTNLSDALNQATRLDRQDKETALRSILIAREDLSVAERREFARELDSDWLAVEVLSKVSDTSVFSDPKLEWESFISRHEDRLNKLSPKKFQLLAEIARAWIGRDGLAVFEEMQVSLPSATLLPEITKSAILKLVPDDPQLAFDFVLEVYFREQLYLYRDLVREIVHSWAQVDPKSTFQATLAVNAPVLRRVLQETTLRQWARRDSRELLNSLETFPDNLHSLIREITVIEMAEKTPDIVSEVLLSINERQRRELVAKRVASKWASQNIEAVLHWIESDHSVHEFKSELKETAFREFARIDAWSAFRRAIELPIFEEDLGLEATVVASVARSQSLDSAVSMLSEVRPGITRIQAYNAAIRQSLLERDAERALALFLELCEYETSFTLRPPKTVIRELPVRVFESLDQISSEVMRIHTAQELLKVHEDEDTFEPRQLERLNEIAKTELSSGLRQGMESVIDSIR